jgi:hypothetical protein
MAAREYLMIVEESAYLTPATTPTVWTTATSYGLSNAAAYYIRLDEGNAFSMRPKPIQVEVPYGGGKAIGAYRVSDKIECKGTLKLKLCISQAPFLLSWAGVTMSGGTAPWTSSEPTGDLASCAVYHAVTEFDGTVKRRVYLGTKVEGWSLTVSEDSTIATLTLNLIASTPQGNAFDSSSDPTSTPFPAPADNNFPTDPFVFLNAGGSNYITYGGTVRTQFSELSINVQNKLATRYFANRFIQFARLMGRKTTCSSKILYNSSPDDRTHFEGTTAESVSIKLNNGTHGFVMDLKAQNIFEQLDDDLPLDNVYMQSSTEANLYDTSAGTDFSLTFT